MHFFCLLTVLTLVKIYMHAYIFNMLVYMRAYFFFAQQLSFVPLKINMHAYLIKYAK